MLPRFPRAASGVRPARRVTRSALWLLSSPLVIGVAVAARPAALHAQEPVAVRGLPRITAVQPRTADGVGLPVVNAAVDRAAFVVLLEVGVDGRSRVIFPASPTARPFVAADESIRSRLPSFASLGFNAGAGLPLRVDRGGVRQPFVVVFASDVGPDLRAFHDGQRDWRYQYAVTGLAPEEAADALARLLYGDVPLPHAREIVTLAPPLTQRSARMLTASLSRCGLLQGGAPPAPELLASRWQLVDGIAPFLHGGDRFLATLGYDVFLPAIGVGGGIGSAFLPFGASCVGGWFPREFVRIAGRSRGVPVVPPADGALTDSAGWSGGPGARRPERVPGGPERPSSDKVTVAANAEQAIVREAFRPPADEPLARTADADVQTTYRNLTGGWGRPAGGAPAGRDGAAPMGGSRGTHGGSTGRTYAAPSSARTSASPVGSGAGAGRGRSVERSSSTAGGERGSSARGSGGGKPPGGR